MCGIAGYIGLKATNINLAKRLLIEAESRGRDATGCLEVNAEGMYTLRKQALPAHLFVENLRFQYRGAGHTFLGHTRFATIGDKHSTLQAHPFTGSRYVLFHNGVMTDYDQKKVSAKFGIVAPNGVDSELFLTFLEKFNSVKALRTKFLPQLSSASNYALVIFDKVTKSVHFLRDNGRPLVYWKPSSGGLLYASTEKILQQALGKDIDVEMLQEFCHLEISSISGEIIRKRAIRPAKSPLDLGEAVGYINKYRKPIRFF